MKLILNFIIIILIFIKVNYSSSVPQFHSHIKQNPQQQLQHILIEKQCLIDIESGTDLKTYNSPQNQLSCYRYNHKVSIKLNCEGDKNQEWRRNQISSFSIDQYILIENSSNDNNLKTITLEQRFKTIVSNNGSVIINNVNEHIAYFLASFKIENKIIFDEQQQQKENKVKDVKLITTEYTDVYGNLYNYSNNYENWDVLVNAGDLELSSKFHYYQKSPINTITSLPNNTRTWFKESARKMKSGKTISNISFSGIPYGLTISKWTVPNDLAYLLLNVTYTSIMGDIVLSSRHIENNSYKLSNFGYYDIKKLDLKTGSIIPIKKQFFNLKLQ